LGRDFQDFVYLAAQGTRGGILSRGFSPRINIGCIVILFLLDSGSIMSRIGGLQGFMGHTKMQKRLAFLMNSGRSEVFAPVRGFLGVILT